MKLNRVYISKSSGNKLGILKGRTGLRPNVLSRIGLILSFAEPNDPDIEEDSTDGLEFNRFTLLGEWDPIIITLLEDRIVANGYLKDNETLVQHFRAHLNRGVRLLYSRTIGPETTVNRPSTSRSTLDMRVFLKKCGFGR